LYLETTTNLPPAHNMRILAISETPSTSPLDEHQEAQADQEDWEGQEDPRTPSEDLTTQELYPPLVSFPYNPQET